MHVFVPQSWWMNALGHQLQWCGVGRSKGPKQSGICCGTGSPNDFKDTSAVLYTDVSTKHCQFGGTPLYISGISGNGILSPSISQTPHSRAPNSRLMLHTNHRAHLGPDGGGRIVSEHWAIEKVVPGVDWGW